MHWSHYKQKTISLPGHDFVLRRQISLGQFAASKATKAHYAASIVDRLCSEKPYSVESLRLAVGLLVESENSTQAKSIHWPDDLLDTAVDEELCQYIIDRAEAYDGARKNCRSVFRRRIDKVAEDLNNASDGIATG